MTAGPLRVILSGTLLLAGALSCSGEPPSACEGQPEGEPCLRDTGERGACLSGACVQPGAVDGGSEPVDAGSHDAGGVDAGAPDSGTFDSGTPDSGSPDSGAQDSGTPDSGTFDSGTPDSGAEDSGTPDSGSPDSGADDSGVPDSGVDAGGGTPDASFACTTPVRLNVGSATSIQPDVAADGQGRATAVWVENAGTVRLIRSAHYTPGAGWGAPTAVGDGGTAAAFPRVVANASGRVLAYWASSEGGTSNRLWVSFSQAGGGWTPQQNVATSVPWQVHEVSAALDDQGEAVVAFSQEPYQGSLTGVFAARYTLDAGWATPVRIDGYSGTGVFTKSPVAALGEFGGGLVAWQDLTTGSARVQASAAYSDGGFGPPTTLSTTANTIRATAAVNAHGEGFVTWEEYAPSPVNGWDIWAARYTPTGFGPATRIEALGAGYTASASSVAVDDSGLGIVAWRQSSSAGAHARASFFHPDAGWYGARALDSSAAGSPKDVLAAVSPLGRGMVVWHYGGGAVDGVGVLTEGLVGPPRRPSGSLGSIDNPARVAAAADGVVVVFAAHDGAYSIYGAWCR